MARKFIKAGAALVVLGLGATALAGCSGAAEESAGGDPTEITMLVLGDKPTNGRLEGMLDKLNAKLEKQANAKLDLFYVEWADWQTQYNLQLLSGDDNVDLITTATDWLFAWENAEKGAFLPLSEDMLKEHAPKTWAQVDADGHWDLTKLDDGQIYFIPEDNFTQYTNHGFFYRGDWATAAGFENGEITKFEDFTKYFQWVKDNKPEAYPWDVAGDAYADITVWREDAANYDGDTREELYAGLSGVDQHHTQTFIGQIYDNLSKKQPGSDPKFFYWGQENGNVFKDILTHGAMGVSAYSAHPEKALEVYDLLRNDEEDYRLINYGIEGTDYILTDDGKLGYPEGYDSSTDSLGSNFWAGRMDEFELDKVTDAPNKQEIYDALDAVAEDYPYSTLL